MFQKPKKFPIPIARACDKSINGLWIIKYSDSDAAKKVSAIVTVTGKYSANKEINNYHFILNNYFIVNTDFLSDGKTIASEKFLKVKDILNAAEDKEAFSFLNEINALNLHKKFSSTLFTLYNTVRGKKDTYMKLMEILPSQGNLRSIDQNKKRTSEECLDPLRIDNNHKPDCVDIGQKFSYEKLFQEKSSKTNTMEDLVKLVISRDQSIVNHVILCFENNANALTVMTALCKVDNVGNLEAPKMIDYLMRHENYLILTLDIFLKAEDSKHLKEIEIFLNLVAKIPVFSFLKSQNFVQWLHGFREYVSFQVNNTKKTVCVNFIKELCVKNALPVIFPYPYLGKNDQPISKKQKYNPPSILQTLITYKTETSFEKIFADNPQYSISPPPVQQGMSAQVDKEFIEPISQPKGLDCDKKILDSFIKSLVTTAEQTNDSWVLKVENSFSYSYLDNLKNYLKELSIVCNFTNEDGISKIKIDDENSKINLINFALQSAENGCQNQCRVQNNMI
jgi:hypothetical protein